MQTAHFERSINSHDWKLSECCLGSMIQTPTKYTYGSVAQRRLRYFRKVEFHTVGSSPTGASIHRSVIQWEDVRPISGTCWFKSSRFYHYSACCNKSLTSRHLMVG